jgi:hypothetical protein
VAGEKNDLRLAIREGLLEFESIAAGHLHIEHEARWPFVRGAVEIGPSRRKRLGRQSCGAKEPREAAPDRLVVVHDADQRIRR